MKKFKKFFSLVIAAALAVSCLPMQAMAEGEETTVVEPEILFHRDYEDYKGGNHQWDTDGVGDYSGNNSKFYGTWSWSIDSVAKSSLAVDGFDGKAVKYLFDNNYHVTNGGSFTDISNGKLYFAFDMWGDELEANRVMNLKLVGSADSEIYVLCWYPGVQWCKDNVSWVTGDTSKDFMNGVSEKTRVELVIDPEAGTVDRYFNGNLAHQLTFTPQTITSATMHISQGHTMDNFAVVHYPEGYTGTYSLTSAKINPLDNTIKVTVNADAYDSNGAYTKAVQSFDNPIAAPYGVSLAEVDATAFTVANGDTPLTVTGVTKGEKNGEYIIAVSEKLAGGTYTVAAKDGLSDIAGLVANENAKSVTFTATAEPQVLLYRDFEDYTGGNQFSNSGKYGTFSFTFDNDFGWKNATAEQGRTGVGFRSNTTNSNGSMYNRYLPEDVRTATSGKVYVTMTSEAIPGVARSGRTAVCGTDGYRYFGFSHGVGYSISGWSTSGMDALPSELQGLDYYQLGVVFNLDTGIQDSYVNGVKVKSATWNGSLDFTKSKFNLHFEDGVIIDNLAIVYYPGDIMIQTFAIKGNDIDTENDKISVKAVSNAVDSNGASGAKIIAPYGIQLANVTTDTFSVEGCTVTSVEKGSFAGEYVITVAEDLVDNVNYKITPKAGLTDIFGAVADGVTANIIRPTEAEVFYYRDFEEYEGGNPWPSADAGKYGKMRLFGDSAFTNSTKTETATGTGVLLDTNGVNPKITEGSTFGPLSDGTLYIAYEEIPGGRREDVYFNRTQDGNAGSCIWCWNGAGWASGSDNWGASTTTGLEAGLNAKYKIELVVDMETSMVDRYINGVCVQENRTLTAKEFKELTFAFSTGSIIDNMSVIYFPEKLVSMPTFSMSAGVVDAENNTVSVFLNSDTVDSDALSSGAVAAPYGVSLKEFDASSFTVEGYTVSSVAKGEKNGEFVITLAEDIEADTEFTVTASADLTDILGSEINAEAASITVGAEDAPVYEISDIEVIDGTASIVYTNTTEKAESFVLIIASYEGERLSEVNFEVVTAETDSVDVAKSVSLVNSVEGKTVKAFIFDSFTSLNPIK